ncbi:unnamed protein product [Ceutorhynchus assimilis]|uniref:Uncharacterized protein n=1 Tax=Ceutorhynchus assimilis TaxID=467358 RepID=A0A9N9MLA8_9CUCU|nr:unnamed protein product [Ceutorhynchus assimilis]
MADGITDVVLLSELKKLKKDELVELVVYQKLPSNYGSNEVLVEIKRKLTTAFSSRENVFFHSDSEFEVSSVPDVSCAKQLCFQRKMELQYSKSKVSDLENLKRHLEDRILEQKQFISLLQENNNNKKHPKDTAASSCSNTATSVEPRKHVGSVAQNPNSIESTSTDNEWQYPKRYGRGSRNRPNNSEQLGGGQVARTGAVSSVHCRKQNISAGQVGNAVNNALAQNMMNQCINLSDSNSSPLYRTPQHRRRKPIIGTNTTTGLQAVQKLGYLHIYRLHLSTTASGLTNLLKTTAPDIKFDIKVHNKTMNSVSFLASFPLEHVGKVYEPTIWPAGACIARYRFPRTSNGSETGNFPNRAFQQPN